MASWPNRLLVRVHLQSRCLSHNQVLLFLSAPSTSSDDDWITPDVRSRRGAPADRFCLSMHLHLLALMQQRFVYDKNLEKQRVVAAVEDDKTRCKVQAMQNYECFCSRTIDNTGDQSKSTNERLSQTCVRGVRHVCTAADSLFKYVPGQVVLHSQV